MRRWESTWWASTRQWSSFVCPSSGDLQVMMASGPGSWEPPLHDAPVAPHDRLAFREEQLGEETLVDRLFAAAMATTLHREGKNRRPPQLMRSGPILIPRDDAATRAIRR
jgi:hypothetical protein